MAQVKAFILKATDRTPAEFKNHFPGNSRSNQPIPFDSGNAFVLEVRNTESFDITGTVTVGANMNAPGPFSGTVSFTLAKGERKVFKFTIDIDVHVENDWQVQWTFQAPGGFFNEPLVNFAIHTKAPPRRPSLAESIKPNLVGTWKALIGDWDGWFDFRSNFTVSWANKDKATWHSGSWSVSEADGVLKWNFRDTRTFAAALPLQQTVRGKILPDGYGFYAMTKP